MRRVVEISVRYATRGIKLEVDRSPKGAREVRVHGRRIDALDRLYLAMRGVRVEAWLSRDTVPVGGKGQGYVVVHGSEMLSGLRVSCGARAADPVRQPIRRGHRTHLPLQHPWPGGHVRKYLLNIGDIERLIQIKTSFTCQVP